MATATPPDATGSQPAKDTEMKQAEAINGTPAAEKKPAEAGASEGENVSKKAKKEEATPGTTLTPEALKSLGVRPYLEKTVVPLLLQGMQQLVKDRPDDPCDALADYLKEHNPRRKAGATEKAS